MKKSIHAYVISFVMLMTSSFAPAQNTELNLNGMAAFEQLRKEYYIGALYLGWPGHDQATIANMPGKKRMAIHVTADRWPALRFAQMWNQAITINNPSAFINANALDILAFTSIPKGDLVEGDRLVIELATNNTTVVSLNGSIALRTKSPALFTMLLNAWIGARPPSTEFKRDILDAPKDQAGKDLAARFDNVRPNDARKKVIAGWGFKEEAETPAAPAVATVTAPPAPAATATVTAPAAPPVPAPAVPAAPTTPPKTVAETKPAPEPKPVEPKTVEPKPAPAPAPAPAAPEPAKPAPVAAPQPDPAAALAAKAAHAQQQEELNAEYAKTVRNKVLRHIEYPRRAAKDNIEGLVMVRIKVDRSGGLSSVEVAQSADDLLDEEALRAVRKAAPFSKAPDALEGSVFESIVPIVFKLSQ